MAVKVKLRRGDQVMVTAGRDKGRKGEVLQVFRDKNRAQVQGVRVVKRHRKPVPGEAEGKIEAMEAPIHISNLAVLDPESGKPTRVGWRFNDEGKKERYAKASGKVLPIKMEPRKK